jgi:hypothetical protein
VPRCRSNTQHEYQLWVQNEFKNYNKYLFTYDTLFEFFTQKKDTLVNDIRYRERMRNKKGLKEPTSPAKTFDCIKARISYCDVCRHAEICECSPDSSQWPKQPEYLLPAEAEEEMKMEKLDDFQNAMITDQIASIGINWEAIMKKCFNSVSKFIAAVALAQRYVRILKEVTQGRRKKPVLLKQTVITKHYVFGKIKTKHKRKVFAEVLNIQTPSAQERLDAQVYIYRQVQMKHLAKIIQDLKDKGKVSHTNPLAKFAPMLDSDGVIRQASRLQFNQNIKEELRCPVILPTQSEFTRLILSEVHEELHHARSISHTLCHLGKYCFTTSIRRTIKNFITHCIRCKHLWPRPVGQRMGPLPDFRVPHGKLSPFSTMTIDAAGPFKTRQGRGRVQAKRYLLLFTCAVTQAVHIELMAGALTEDFLSALSRFCNERSAPDTIICDNAGQFVKGARSLEGFDDLDPDVVQRQHPQIRFQFIPARTPHVNGVTERIIQSMKTSLRHVITDGLLNDDQLLTAAKKVQGILNSRPLAYHGVSPDEPKPLTPADFLADKALVDISIHPDKLSLQSRLRLVQQTVDNTWKRFQREVIPKLNTITKWYKSQPNLEVGDVVVVMDAEESGKFPLGVVTEVFSGPNGLVRIVRVRIRGHETKRHASRLMLLLRDTEGAV